MKYTLLYRNDRGEYRLSTYVRRSFLDIMRVLDTMVREPNLYIIIPHIHLEEYYPEACRY